MVSPSMTSPGPDGGRYAPQTGPLQSKIPETMATIAGAYAQTLVASKLRRV